MVWWCTAISLYDTNDQLLDQMVDGEASAWELTQIIAQSVVSTGLYRLHLVNTGGRSVGHDIRISYETDIDGNDVLDSEEFWFDQEYFSMDSDLDTISDAQEMLIGTLRDSTDSDSDSLPDPWEIENGLDPLNPDDASQDLDSDGVSNLMEYLNDCNPNSPDSDADSMPDLWEIENGLDPTFDDSQEDPDSDAVTNVKEYEEGTDPHFAEFRPERLFVPTLSLGVAAIIILVMYWKFRSS